MTYFSINIEEVKKNLIKVMVGIDEFTTETQRKLALNIDKNVSRATPVDTGRARGNWIPNLNSPNPTPLELDQLGSKPDINSVLGDLKMGDIIYISNNLKYIGSLNDGHSKQADAGYVYQAVLVSKEELKL